MNMSDLVLFSILIVNKFPVFLFLCSVARGDIASSCRRRGPFRVPCAAPSHQPTEAIFQSSEAPPSQRPYSVSRRQLNYLNFS